MAERDIAVKFTGDSRDLERAADSAERSITGSATSMGGGLAKLAGPAAIAATAVAGVGLAAWNFAEAAMEDEASASQLAQQLRQAAGASDEAVAGAERYISTLSKAAAVADDELRPALATLATATGDTGKAQELLGLSADIAAGSGKDLSTVAEAMAKAQQGNVGALGRLGIATKDAAGETMSLDQILESAKGKFEGAAAAAAGTGAGGMKQAGIAFDELKERLGSKLLPILGELATTFTEKVMPVLEGLVTWAEEEWPKLMEQIQPGLDELKRLFSEVFTEVKRIWDEWGDDFARVAGTILVAWLKDVIIKIGDFLKALQWVLEKANEFSAGIKVIGDAISNVAENFSKGWQAIKDAVGAGVDWVTDKVGKIGERIGAAMSGVADLVTKPFQKAFNAIADLWNRTIGSLTFEFPSWIPGLGGNRIDVPDIPRFAVMSAGLTVVMPPGSDGYDVARQLATFQRNVSPTSTVAVR